MKDLFLENVDPETVQFIAAKVKELASLIREKVVDELRIQRKVNCSDEFRNQLYFYYFPVAAQDVLANINDLKSPIARLFSLLELTRQVAWVENLPSIELLKRESPWAVNDVHKDMLKSFRSTIGKLDAHEQLEACVAIVAMELPKSLVTDEASFRLLASERLVRTHQQNGKFRILAPG